MPAERQFATSLGVSRPSLREAIQQLNSQGVLISRRGDGTYIQQLPEQWPQQLIVNPISNLIEEDPLYRFDVQEARLVLEGGRHGMPHYVQRLRIAPKFIIILMKLVAIKMRVTQHRLRSRMLNSIAIAEASHNVVLIQMMRSLFDLLQYNVLLGRKKFITIP